MENVAYSAENSMPLESLLPAGSNGWKTQVYHHPKGSDHAPRRISSTEHVIRKCPFQNFSLISRVELLNCVCNNSPSELKYLICGDSHIILSCGQNSEDWKHSIFIWSGVGGTRPLVEAKGIYMFLSFFYLLVLWNIPLYSENKNL